MAGRVGRWVGVVLELANLKVVVIAGLLLGALEFSLRKPGNVSNRLLQEISISHLIVPG